MSSPKILVVDDDKNVLELLKKQLEDEGFSVITAADGKTAVALAQSEMPDAMVLDLVIPGMHGIKVCQYLRQQEETRLIPILMLSARSEVDNRVLGLEFGANDFLAKPCSFRELAARIRVLLRSAKQFSELSLTHCGPLKIDWERSRIKVGDKENDLSPKELRLLRMLIRAQGNPLSRQELLKEVWGYDPSLSLQTRTLDQHISNLRKKLEQEAHRIKSVKDVGYSFDSSGETRPDFS